MRRIKHKINDADRNNSGLELNDLNFVLTIIIRFEIHNVNIISITLIVSTDIIVVIGIGVDIGENK